MKKSTKFSLKVMAVSVGISAVLFGVSNVLEIVQPVKETKVVENTPEQPSLDMFTDDADKITNNL